jgi:hypothetical protein
LIGEHNVLDSIHKYSEPLSGISFNVFTTPGEKLPTGMLKLNFQLVEQVPALIHMSHLKSTSSDRDQETERYGSDLRDCLDCAVSSGLQSHQSGNDRRADHDQPPGDVERLLCPATYNMGHQYACIPLGAYVFLSFGMTGVLIDER